MSKAGALEKRQEMLDTTIGNTVSKLMLDPVSPFELNCDIGPPFGDSRGYDLEAELVRCSVELMARGCSPEAVVRPTAQRLEKANERNAARIFCK